MSKLKAVLGPTNTGKTHYAIERMVAHGSGMIGLPLRLLAREVYDRIVAKKGASQVALVTGEERIVPKATRFWVCTVESMPVDLSVDFVAIDEIQLAEDPDRGHIFTDRILNLRGTYETLFLGSNTMTGILRDLDFSFETEPRERFSELSYAGPCKLTKLPKRTAIVAFSAEDVYAMAELLRRQKGGAAVVMGALSPRTRNAQVELYQSQEVDYIVATDAIGMGLNLDVDRVVFAARKKFDGRRFRGLTAAECGQIAGRAGRFRTDGEFGETADCVPFDDDMRWRIENHQFEPVDSIMWRNSNLDFSSVQNLIKSLEATSGSPVLIQNPRALDEWVLRRMSEDEEIGPNVTGDKNVRRLWDLARLPDFRKAGHEGHGQLVLGLTATLKDPDARLSDDGMERRIADLSVTAGGIPKLQQRLAAIRTWTYAANRSDWLENPEKWQTRTREIEDSLSDALHSALTARFVDRRTTQLLAGLKKEDALLTELMPDGSVVVEGHAVGRLVGLTFEPISSANTLEGKTVRNAAQSAVRPLILERLNLISDCPDISLSLAKDGHIQFQNAPIAKITKGADWLVPSVELMGAAECDLAEKQPASARIHRWVTAEIAKRLPTHSKLKHENSGESLEGLAKGIAFRIVESGAAVDLRNDDPSHRITPEQREALKAIGLRTGRVAAYAPDAQKPAAQQMISILRTAFDGAPCPQAPEGAGSFPVDTAWPDAALSANGYIRFGKRAVRADLCERLAWEVAKRRKEAEKSQFAVEIDLASVISCPGEDFPAVLKGLGLMPAEKDPETGVPTLWRYGGRRPEGSKNRNAGPRKPRSKKPDQSSRGPRKAKNKVSDPDSPFAALSVLLPEKKTSKPTEKKNEDASKKADAPKQTPKDVNETSQTPVSDNT